MKKQIKHLEEKASKKAMKEFESPKKSKDLMEKAMEDFKETKEFKNMVHQIEIQYYSIGFDKTITKAKCFYPQLDFNMIEIRDDNKDILFQNKPVDGVEDGMHGVCLDQREIPLLIVLQKELMSRKLPLTMVMILNLFQHLILLRL